MSSSRALTNGWPLIAGQAAGGPLALPIVPPVSEPPPLPAATPLPIISAAPIVLHHVKGAGSTYTGPALRLARVSDGVQADIPFDNGRPSLSAARTFAGTQTLSHGILTTVLSYDTTGGGNHITWSTGSAAVPFVSERDAHGPGFLDLPLVDLGSQKYAFNGVSQVQRFGTLPSGLTVNAQNLGFFAVLAPMQSQQRNAMITVGATTGAGRVTVYVEGATSPLGLGSLGTTNGTAGTDTKAPFNMLPRNGRQVISLLSRPGAGKLIHVEDRSFQGTAIEDSRTLTGGGIGVTGGGSTYWLDASFYALAIYPSTISESEAAQLRAALSSTFDTARRANGVFVAGSSTPEGQGATNNRSYPRLMAGLLGSKRCDLWNGAIAGQTLAASLASASTQIFPVLAGYAAPVLWIDGAANDFLSGSTDAQVYKTLKDYIAAFKAQFPNGKAVPVTPTGKSSATQAQNDYRLSYIAMLKAGKADLLYDAYFDRAGIPQAQTLTDTTYFRQEPDGSFLHANDTLHLIYAQAAAPILQAQLS